MGLKHVWIRTLADGLLRADQVIGISCHPTPELVGKPSRWLLNATLAIPAGSGTVEGWDVADLHRTLAQTDSEPRHAADLLAKSLATLAEAKARGILHPVPDRGEIRFEFTPFGDDDARLATHSERLQMHFTH